jgi:hypothetical protein
MMTFETLYVRIAHDYYRPISVLRLVPVTPPMGKLELMRVARELDRTMRASRDAEAQS